MRLFAGPTSLAVIAVLGTGYAGIQDAKSSNRVPCE